MLRSAHHIDGEWLPPGPAVIEEQRFDPSTMTRISIAELVPVLAPEPKPADVTSIAPESIPALLGMLSRRIDTVESTAASIFDLAQLTARVRALEARIPNEELKGG